MKLIKISFTVSGTGRFPIDMLRYDGVVPSSETDSARIERSIDGTGSDLKTISVTKPDGYKYWTPNAARWKSFGWDIVQTF